jgi:hypothetical protein
MRRVLFLDKSDPVIFEWAKYYADKVCNEDTIVTLWSYWRKTEKSGKLYVKNYSDFKTDLTVADIERKVKTPFWTNLACERSFFDFSYHTTYYSYSRMDNIERNKLIESVIRSLWQAVGETDIIIEGLKDNFITAVAASIAASEGKELKMIRPWSIWRHSLHIVNQPDQTSSEIREAYAYYLNRITEQDYPILAERVKKAMFSQTAGMEKTFMERIELIRYKYRSYEKISIRNLVMRKLRKIYGTALASFNIRLIDMQDVSYPFVVYAMHVMPEASILGSDPDIAYQFDTIRRLSLGMPWGVKLICKIHPGDKIGKDLDYDFIKKISSLPNVEILKTKTRISEVFKSPFFLALATINGTVAIDGLIAGKPVMLFGKTIFSIAEYFEKPANVTEIWELCQKILTKEYNRDLKSAAAILRAMESTKLTGDIDTSKPEKWLDLYEKILYIVENGKSEFQMRELE